MIYKKYTEYLTTPGVLSEALKDRLDKRFLAVLEEFSVVKQHSNFFHSEIIGSTSRVVGKLAEVKKCKELIIRNCINLQVSAYSDSMSLTLEGLLKDVCDYSSLCVVDAEAKDDELAKITALQLEIDKKISVLIGYKTRDYESLSKVFRSKVIWSYFFIALCASFALSINQSVIFVTAAG